MIDVRQARPGDGHHLLHATLTLAQHHGWEHKLTATSENLEAAVFAPAPIIGAFLAFDGDVFAGSIIWHRSFSSNRGREVIYMEDLIVLPDHRRKGVADALMAALAKHAVSAGYPSIFWMMMNWNSGAQAFYAKIGAEVEDKSSLYVLQNDALMALTR